MSEDFFVGCPPRMMSSRNRKRKACASRNPEIMVMHRNGIPVWSIAKRYHLAESTVYKILRATR